MLEKIRQQIAKKFGAKGGPRRRRQHGGDPRGPRGDAEGRLRRAGFARCGKGARASERPHRGDFGRDVPRRGAGLERRLPRSANTTKTSWPARSATAPSPKRRCCRAPACSCRRAAPPSRTRACSAATCRSSSPICAPAAWNARWSARMRRSPTRCTTSTICCITAIRQLDIAEAQREALRGQCPCARRRGARNLSAARRSRKPFHEIVADGGGRLDVDNAVLRAQSRQARRRAGGVPGRQDAAVLRRHGEGGARQRRPLFGRHRSVEVHAAASNASRSAARTRWSSASRTRRCWKRCRRASSSSAGRPTRRPASSKARPQPDGETKRLMLDRNNYYADHRRTRRLPRLRRGHRDPAGHRGQPRDPRQAAQGAYPRGGEPDRAAERQAAVGVEQRAPIPSGASASRGPSRRWRSGCTCSKAARPATGRRAP